MAALPLTLDTLQSPNIEEAATEFPLMSPQIHKADTSSNNTLLTITPERPSNLALESSQQQQQQQHSNVTPTHGTISPALSSAGSLSPSFLPEMPQWKRDLIQRRKQNVQRTISASSPTASAAASSPLAASPTTSSLYGLKTSTSSSSVRSLAGSNTNIDQVASDGLHTSTKDYNKTSLSAYSSSSLSSAATTKVNKQHAITTTTTTTAMPATIIKSPIQEKAEKLFGGQYTATSSSSSSSISTTTTTLTTKEEKITIVTQQELMEGSLENEEEHWEKSKKNKEYMIDNEEEDDENDETRISTVTTTTTTAGITSNKQQMATRLTGSTTHNNILAQREGMPKEREHILNNNKQQHNNITGANVILQNQSLHKCESERLVCAANISSCSSAITNNNNTNINNTNCGGTTSGVNSSGSVVKISQKLQDNQFIKNEQQQQINTNTKKFIKFKTNSYSQDLKSPTKSTLSSSSSSSSALATNCAIKKKMVAVQEMKKSTQNTATHLHPISTTCNNSQQQQQQQQQANNRANNRSVGGVANSSASNATDLDNNEDLSYGPGIVSKLRCRYLSLALRESMEQQRLNKDQLRRSTSLNNLLDNNEDDDENCDDEDEEEEEEENIEVEGELHDNQKNNENSVCKKTGILKNSCNNQEKRFSHNSQGSNGVGVTFTETSFNKRSRHLKRGNDSLKRARSVEALLSEKSPWQSRTINSTPTCVTIEDKIHNARERLHQGTDHMPPKRLTSIIDDTERPPPDLVKQTLKMFEASANRRPRTTNRSNSKGDVASKVETFKNIIKDQKPVVSYPKPASPTKKLNSTPLQKPLKSYTPQASDLLQSPLGRKTLATANSTYANDGSTPLKTNNTLSDNTPDIIPRQKVLNERDFKQTKFTTNQINKEMFLNSIRDSPLSNTETMDSPLNAFKREQKEKFEVDSPLTALTKELSKLKLSDNNTPIKKIDNFANDKSEITNGGGGGGAGGDGVSVGGDACLSHKAPHNNEETKELNSSLKNENDKQKQINNETIDETNEATVNYNDCLATKASPPTSSSDLSDGEEDDEYGGLKTKRITRTALDNIAKAGCTQQFKFNTSSSNSPNNTHSTSSPLNSGKQIGVIRPLLNTNQQQQQQKISSDMDTLKHSTPSSLTSREIEKNRINDLKKSSSTTLSSTTSSSPNTSLDNVIKSSSSSSSVSSNTSSTAAASSGYSDVDTVISATNSPLWAMRKRRQAPPAAPAENTTMVFNFSNRKEVPDYIENDGVIFRRKRELPKPNESGFVLLGDLSVETSTDFDCDDFSMCPPSPCDVEFENANIVIDGKSSIRQKSKDATFRVQFNDTLTSTFEYPSEASLIVDDSFSAYNDGYTQPHGSSGDDFTHAFQNLVLENFAASADHVANNPYPLHHVADEIIQLPTNEANSPANITTGVTTPTKNILGNLPLDYPDLEKGIQLTIPTTTTTATTTLATQDNEPKRSRKDLKLPLGNHQQKPPLPMKRFQMMPPITKPQNLKGLQINSKDLQLPNKIVSSVQKPKEEEELQNGKNMVENKKDGVDASNTIVKQRKTPQVLNNPQYACFLQQQQQDKPTKYPVQRSRSNEFQKSFGSLAMSTSVSRSNSLRNLEKFHTSQALNPTSFTTSTSLYFSTEVNSTIENILNSKSANCPASSIQHKRINENAKENRTLKSISLHNLTQSKETFDNFSNSCHELSECIENVTDNLMKSSKSLNASTLQDSSDNLLNSKTKSNDNLNLNTLTDNSLSSLTNSIDHLGPTKEYAVNMTVNLLKSKSKSVENFSSTAITNTKSDNYLTTTVSSQNLTDYSLNLTDNLSVGLLTTTLRSSVNDLTDYFSLQSKSNSSIDNIKSDNDLNSIKDGTVNSTENLLKSKTKSVDSILNVDSNESTEYSSKMSDNLNKTNPQTSATDILSKSGFINLNKTLQMSIDSLDDYQDALDVNPEDKTDSGLISSSINPEELNANKEEESKEINETPKYTSTEIKRKAWEILEDISIGSNRGFRSKSKEILNNSKAFEILQKNSVSSINESLTKSKHDLSDSEALEILEDIAVGSNTASLFDFAALMRKDKSKGDSLETTKQVTNEISTENVDNIKKSYKSEEIANKNIVSTTSKNNKSVHAKTTEKLFNFNNLACQNISTYSTFRKSQNFYRHSSKSFKNSLKFYETLNDNVASIKRSVSLTDNLTNKGEIKRKFFAKKSAKQTDDKNQIVNLDSPTENSYSFEYYDAFSDLNGNLINHSRENVNNLTDNDCLNNNENLLNQKQKNFEVKHEIKQNLANDLKENLNLTENCLVTGTKQIPHFSTKISADLYLNVNKQTENTAPIDYSSTNDQLCPQKSIDSGFISEANITDSNSFEINKNLSTILDPNNINYFNTSPRPFRCKYESPEKCSTTGTVFNSVESLTLTSPRPFKVLCEAKTLDNLNRSYTHSDCELNSDNSQKFNLTNTFGTLTNNLGTLTKSIDSALNSKTASSIKSNLFDICSTTTTKAAESADKFSTTSPTLPPKTFSNTKHLKLQTKFTSPTSSPMVKNPVTTTTTGSSSNKTNKTSLKKCTNFITKVEVSKTNSYTTSISHARSSSSFSSTSFCRTSSQANSTANTQKLSRNATTIASNSTNPPKVLPRRIFATATRNRVATTSSSTSSTATTATAPVSCASSSTSSCYNASTSTTTCNSTPLRRRIPGNTLYYV